MRESYKKKKTNLVEFIMLVALIIFIWYFSISTNITESNLKEKISDWKKEIILNNHKIEEKEIYKRLQTYWYRLSSIDNLIKYKDSIVNWYEFLLEFRETVPRNVTFNTYDYSAETNKISINLTSPSEERLLETLKLIEETKWLKWIEFNTIWQEKISFIWDKVQYKGFSTNITVYIDEEYLEKRYDSIRNYKKLKYDIWNSENVMDLTTDFNSIELNSTWSMNNFNAEIIEKNSEVGNE